MNRAATLKALAPAASVLVVFVLGFTTAFISQAASPDYHQLLKSTALLLALTTLSSFAHCYFFKRLKILVAVILAFAYLFFAELALRLVVQ